MLAPRQRPLQLFIWLGLTALLVVLYRTPTYIHHSPHTQTPEEQQLQKQKQEQEQTQEPLQPSLPTSTSPALQVDTSTPPTPTPTPPLPPSPSPTAEQQTEPQQPQQSSPPQDPLHLVYHPPVVPEDVLKNIEAPANSTLGFGAVVVVSKKDSPRRHALIQAANVTEIELTIPDQPLWSEEDVAHFQNGPDSKMGHGSIYAWLGHHNALQWFLDSGLETALILEDDVDWDIHLRSLQAPLAAQAARTLLHSGDNTNYFWGRPDQWDLLYIGHCGDYFESINRGVGPGHQFPSNLTSIPHTVFKDPSLPEYQDLHPFTGQLMLALGIPEHCRALHRSRFPLCTFAYAVTRDAARRLIEELAPAKEPDTENHPRAYDVAILNSCRAGFNVSTGEDSPEGLRCYSMNPELFHHMAGKSTIAGVDEGNGRVVGIPPVDAEGAEQVVQRQETSNIGCGFYGGHFGFRDDDVDRLHYLQLNVGQRGQCLKPAPDQLE